VSISRLLIRRRREGAKTMRKLILKMSTTLDGFVGGANGRIDWLFSTMDEKARQWIADTIGQAGVHIMGSRNVRRHGGVLAGFDGQFLRLR
jgi:RibD C-terminal domain